MTHIHIYVRDTWHRMRGSFTREDLIKGEHIPELYRRLKLVNHVHDKTDTGAILLEPEPNFFKRL